MSGRFKYDQRETVRFGSFKQRLSRSELHRNVPEIVYYNVHTVVLYMHLLHTGC